MALFAYWAIHVKGQFADARASLTPGFRKVHGVVAIIVAIIFVIILPGMAAPLIGWQSLGFVSISTLLFGIILWIILRWGFTFFLFMSSGFVFIFHKPIWTRIEPIFTGKEPIQAFIIMSLGVILSITGIIRLFLLNEEKPEYHPFLKSPTDRRTAQSDHQRQKLEKSYSLGERRWFANGKAVRMIYHARHATDSYWSGMQRWNHSNRSVWWALFFAAFFTLLFALIDFFNGTSNLPALGFLVAISLPIMLVIEQFTEKSRFMAQDFMMPVRRDSYLKELGISLALRQFFAWAVIIAVSVVWMFSTATKPNPEYLIYSIPYSVMMQIWLFGLAVWIISCRSFIKSKFIIIIAAIFSMTMRNMQAFDAQRMFPWWSLILGALLACLGLLLTWWGYRRWLVADLE